jgi:hypothetical protein
MLWEALSDLEVDGRGGNLTENRHERVDPRL